MSDRNLEQVDPKVGVYIGILDTAAILLANPLLGIREVGRITALLGFAGDLIRDIAVGSEELQVVNDQINLLVSEARGPSEAEWASWETRLAATDARFARLRESLGGGS